MPKHNPNFAISPTFNFDAPLPDGFWKRIRAAYGRKINKEARIQIKTIFLIYRSFAKAERQMKKPEELAKAIERFQDASARLAELLPLHPAKITKGLSISVLEGDGTLNGAQFFEPVLRDVNFRGQLLE